MAEYIEREALINWAKEFYPNDKHFVSGIMNAPAADVVEVRHGKWIENEDGILYCSECKEEAPHESIFEEQFDYDWEENLVPCGYEEHKEYIKTNYCPNCGAKMDGDTK